MINQLENQIRDLKKELAEIKKNQALLRLQPCLGDPEIRKKEERFIELEGRAAALNESVRGLTKKYQLLLSGSAPRTAYDLPESKRGS